MCRRAQISTPSLHTCCTGLHLWMKLQVTHMATYSAVPSRAKVNSNKKTWTHEAVVLVDILFGQRSKVSGKTRRRENTLEEEKRQQSGAPHGGCASPSKVTTDATVTLPAVLMRDRGLHLACSI